jgi:medium-chain acyl-[acyl-carrier-protein] hydrolase
MPYAGGAASIYRSWPNAFPSDIDVCAVELPGRGTRLNEKPYTSISLLVDALCRAILPFLDRPFALFGHSMGALLAFETARLMGRVYQITPSHLFISGHSAPQFPMRYPAHDMAEKELIELLKNLSGTPPEIFQNRELMDLMLPILRADFALCESYKYLEDRPLECPISVFAGLNDEETPRAHLEGWREHTTGPFNLRMLPGGHFFIHGSQKQIMECVMREIFDSGLQTVGKGSLSCRREVRPRSLVGGRD